MANEAARFRAVLLAVGSMLIPVTAGVETSAGGKSAPEHRAAADVAAADVAGADVAGPDVAGPDVAAAAVAAAPDPRTAPSPPESAVDAAPHRLGTSGVRVFRDPVTGELTSNPTAEQRRRFSIAARTGLERSWSGLEPFALDRGGRGVNLQGRFHSALVVEVGPDGRLRARCGDPAHPSASHSHRSEDAAGGHEELPRITTARRPRPADTVPSTAAAPEM